MKNIIKLLFIDVVMFVKVMKKKKTEFIYNKNCVDKCPEDKKYYTTLES